MTRGISESDVHKRRSMFGFNELESPSENLFLKFLGFFKGPILYGELTLHSSLLASLTLILFSQ